MGWRTFCNKCRDPTHFFLVCIMTQPNVSHDPTTPSGFSGTLQGKFSGFLAVIYFLQRKCVMALQIFRIRSVNMTTIDDLLIYCRRNFGRTRVQALVLIDVFWNVCVKQVCLWSIFIFIIYFWGFVSCRCWLKSSYLTGWDFGFNFSQDKFLLKALTALFCLKPIINILHIHAETADC